MILAYALMALALVSLLVMFSGIYFKRTAVVLIAFNMTYAFALLAVGASHSG